ncbi:MAG: sugar ABC transporter permease [Nitrososphaerota archaeon]|nr:sugar ABC transporter permease [Nitrososphaerota archaeon]
MAKFWYLFFVPLFALLSVVEFYPIAESVYLSLVAAGDRLQPSNYVAMVNDSAFWNSVNISLLYSMTSTFIAVGLGLGLAFLLTENLRGRGVLEAFYVVPLAVAPIVVGTLWSPPEMWDDIQTFLHFILGQPYFNELSPAFFFPVMAYSEAWEWGPLIMLVALSVISSTPRAVYESAELYGASGLRKFRRVTLPIVMRSPVMRFVIVLRFIDAMRAFEIPQTWASWVSSTTAVGSPVDTLSLFLYKLMFIPTYNFPIGLISAVAVSLFLVSLAAAALMLGLVRTIGGR